MVCGFRCCRPAERVASVGMWHRKTEHFCNLLSKFVHGTLTHRVLNKAVITAKFSDHSRALPIPEIMDCLLNPVHDLCMIPVGHRNFTILLLQKKTVKNEWWNKVKYYP